MWKCLQGYDSDRDVFIKPICFQNRLMKKEFGRNHCLEKSGPTLSLHTKNMEYYAIFTHLLFLNELTLHSITFASIFGGNRVVVVSPTGPPLTPLVTVQTTQSRTLNFYWHWCIDEQSLTDPSCHSSCSIWDAQTSLNRSHSVHASWAFLWLVMVVITACMGRLQNSQFAHPMRLKLICYFVV